MKAKILDKYKECQNEVVEEQRLFEADPEFMDLLEKQQDNEFVEEDTTKPEEIEDWMRNQGKIYDGQKNMIGR